MSVKDLEIKKEWIEDLHDTGWSEQELKELYLVYVGYRIGMGSRMFMLDLNDFPLVNVL